MKTIASNTLLERVCSLHTKFIPRLSAKSTVCIVSLTFGLQSMVTKLVLTVGLNSSPATERVPGHLRAKVAKTTTEMVDLAQQSGASISVRDGEPNLDFKGTLQGAEGPN